LDGNNKGPLYQCAARTSEKNPDHAEYPAAPSTRR
jgi:hypothetical protein